MVQRKVTSAVVLGMHRSGTSLVGGVLQRLGVDMGEQPEHLKKHESNPLGHFEDNDFLNLNEDILRSSGGKWDSPPPRHKIQQQSHEYSNKITDMITSRNKRFSAWGWKDPRTSLTIDLFLPHLTNPKLILCYRNEKNVAHSLSRRDHTSYDKALSLKKKYDKSLKEFMADHSEIETIDVHYEDITANPSKFVKGLVKFLGISPSQDQIKEAIDFIKTPAQINKAASEIVQEKDDIPSVSVVVLSWNTKVYTKTCVHSLRKLNYENMEIIVVDNGSADGSKDWLKAQSDITYIDLEKNYGFTGGQLVAFEKVRSKYVALINSDAYVDKDWLSQVVKVAESDESIAFVGGKSYLWTDVFKLGSTDNPYYSYQEVDYKTGFVETKTHGPKITDTHALSGAALLIRSSISDSVGYFDDRYFAYYEETDLIARSIRAGFRAVYTPDALVWHRIAGSSSDKSNFYYYQMNRNRFIFAYKNLDKEYLWSFVRSYSFLAFKSLFKVIGNPEARQRVKTAYWNLAHLATTRRARKQVLSLGKSYVKKLPKYDPPEDVTVVIPCYNYQKYVGEAIDSTLGQSLKPTRIIVIDDGSTDNSLEIISKYKGRVEIVTKENSGVIDTKNLGLKMSSTTWTIFLDADDILKKDYIKKVVNKANQDKLDVVYTDIEYFGEKTDGLKFWTFSPHRLATGNYIHNSALIRTHQLKLSGGYKQAMSEGYEDWELYITLFELGAKFGYLPKLTFLYRQHAGSLGRNTEAENVARKLTEVVKNLHPQFFLYRETTDYKRILTAIKEYPQILLLGLLILPYALLRAIRAGLWEVRNTLIIGISKYLRSRRDR